MNTISGDKAGLAAKGALEAGEGILRLAPTWVPRSFLQPGRRLKLHPQDYYALGKHRGGIDERWFGSTTPAANDNRNEDEGLSYVVHDGARFTLKDAVDVLGGEIIGDAIWNTYKKWPVYSKFFDNMGPIPHHMHQNAEQAALVGQEGKPESYYFPPQMNAIGNNFPYTFMGFEPGTTREQVRRCIENWNKGDNGILDLSKAYRLKPGTGWMIGPCILHAPGSLVTYEPQWGSDVFGMYQSLVEGRDVPWALLVKDMPADKHQDIDFIVDQLDWESNVDPNFKENHYLEPIIDTQDDAHTDRWIVYGGVKGKDYFSAKELTVNPGQKVTIKDKGATSLITVQGRGRVGHLPLESPDMIRFGEMTEDEVFITAKRAAEGYEIENLAKECPLVILRYFGPDVNPQAPAIGSWAYSIGPYENTPIPWEEVLKTLKALNFDGVEVGGFSIHPSPENAPNKEDREKIVAQAKEIGIGFSGFVPNLWGEKLINTEDPSGYIAAFKQGAQFAHDLGIKGVRVDCVQPPTIHAEIDYDVAKKRVVSTWKECSKIAADLGCYVTWEFEPGFAFNKPSDVFRIVDEVNEENFGIEFDTCHAEMVAGVGARQHGTKEVLPGGCLEMAQKLKGKINHVHLIDSDGTLHHDETSSHPPFGDGYLDFDAIVPALLDAGVPHDWWTIDLCFWPDAWKVTERCKKSIDALNKKFCS